MRDSASGAFCLVALASACALAGCSTAWRDRTITSAADRQAARALGDLGGQCTVEDGEVVAIRFFMPHQTVRDDDLVHLRQFDHLRELWLHGTQVSDRGLEHLKELRNLRLLELPRHAQISDAGVADLQRALPDCRIERIGIASL